MRIREEPRLENKERQREIEDVTRVVLRPLGSPLPLAFLALGVSSAMQSALQLGLIPQSEGANLAFVFGAFVSLPLVLAAIFAFLARETLGAKQKRKPDEPAPQNHHVCRLRSNPPPW
jgi:hypothetical protein